MTMIKPRFLCLVCLCTSGVSSFVLVTRKQASSVLHSKKGVGEVEQRSFAVGTFVEFEEKKRSHIGKIDTVEQKSNGACRYDVVDSEGKRFGIADKAIKYFMPCPNSPGQANKLYDDFCKAQDAPTMTLQEELDITPDLLEMAWEEVAEDDQDHMMTPDSLVDLVHSHPASPMEKYMAWKLLQTEIAHVFFKEIKDHGRVVAFKAKPPKSVEAAKEVYCKSHGDSEICFLTNKLAP